MKKLLSILVLLAMALSLFAGCSSTDEPYEPTGDGLGAVETPEDDSEPPEQALTLIYYREKTLNPLKCNDYTNRVIISLLYQGLFAVNRDYEPEPMLCKQYRISPDSRIYTFYPEKAKFSNGAVLTAQDVAATLLAAKESQIYKGRFFHITDIAVTEDGGVEIKLDTPMENLPQLLDIPIIPEADLESDRPAGTGPYILDESGDLSRLRRRSDNWSTYDSVITASSITLLEGKSNTQIRDEFQFGDVDLVCADPCSDYFADYRCDYELWNCENGMFIYLACSADSDVFSNDVIRTALTHAIDREFLTDEFYRGYASAVTLPASPEFPYYNQNLASRYTYDAEKFASAVRSQLMMGEEVVLLVNKGDSIRIRVAHSIADMLSAAGLQVTVKELSGSDYTYAIYTRDYDLYLGQTMLSPNMDLTPFFHTYGELSYGGVNEVGAYALCLDALANHGNYYSLYKYVMDKGLLCPVLFRSYAVYSTRGLLTELEPARDNVFFYSAGKNMEHALLRNES